MTKQLSAIAVAACTALSTIGMPTALAKQQCSPAMPSNSHRSSWRLIDGRKCWYEGKPGLSKSLLEWPKKTSEQPGSSREVTGYVTEKPGNPSRMTPKRDLGRLLDYPSDCQALAPDACDTTLSRFGDW